MAQILIRKLDEDLLRRHGIELSFGIAGLLDHGHARLGDRDEVLGPVIDDEDVSDGRRLVRRRRLRRGRGRADVAVLRDPAGDGRRADARREASPRHQPLHVGRPGDRGGNDVKVKWFGRDTNLHAVWDSALVEDEDLSFTEWAERLTRRTTPSEVIRWWVPNPRVWITESAGW